MHSLPSPFNHTQPMPMPWRAAPAAPPALRLAGVPVPGGLLSFSADAGELVHLHGGSLLAQLRVLAVACGHGFGGPGRCEIAGQDTMALDPQGRQALRRRHVARAMLRDVLPPHLPLLAGVAQAALQRGVPAAAALRRASIELDALGLGERQSLPPSALTPAEHRIGLIARALVCRPLLLVAEQPDHDVTPGDLPAIARALELGADSGCCVLMTCAQAHLAQRAHRHVSLGPALGVVRTSVS